MADHAVNTELNKRLQNIVSRDVDGKPLPFKNVSFAPATIDSADDADTAADGLSDMDSLKDRMKTAVNGPAASVNAGHLPLPTHVGIIPTGDDPAIKANYDFLVQMGSMSSLYTAIQDIDKRKARGRKTPYNISDPKEAEIAAADSADSGFQALLHPLAGFFNITGQTARSQSFEMHKTSLHLDFLTKIFTDFSLTKSALLQLDGVLTNFVQAISNIDISSSDTKNTVDQTLWVNQVLSVNVSGDDANPEIIHQPQTKLIFIHIDSEAWRRAVGKSSDEGFIFHFNMDVIDAELNVEKYLASKDKFDKIFVQLTDKNLQEFGTAVTGTTVQTNPDGGDAPS